MSDENNLYPFLKQVKNCWEKPDFAVPDGYFENFTGELMAKINTTGEQAESFILAGYDFLKTTSPYSVPENYFQHLPDSLGEKLKQPPQFKTRLAYLKKSAVAASLLILIGLGGFLYRDVTNRERITVANQNLSQDLQAVADSQLADFLNLNGKPASTTQNLKKNIDPDQFFNSVPTKDLKKFLSETGSETDESTILN